MTHDLKPTRKLHLKGECLPKQNATRSQEEKEHYSLKSPGGNAHIHACANPRTGKRSWKA